MSALNLSFLRGARHAFPFLVVIVPFAMPVSYTHLDVYKRQALPMPEPRALFVTQIPSSKKRSLSTS